MKETDLINTSKEELIEEYKKLKEEYTALLESSRAILLYEDFEYAAREIFNYCKKVTKATSGYVALLNEDGSENEVLFLDSGGLECTVDENLPMPIRGLREKAYTMRKGVYDNDFFNSHWVKFMPEGHMVLKNVLFAPLIINNQAVGLIGLANKKGGFNDRDVEFISVLGDVAALSLKNNRNLDLLRESEEKYRLITEHASDTIWVYNYDKGRFTFVSPSIYNLTGFSVEQVMQNSLEDTFSENSIIALEEIIRTNAYKLRNKDIVKYDFVIDVKQTCSNRNSKWIELSASIHLNNNEVEVIGLSRDIEERKEMEKELLYLSSHDQLTKLYNRHYFVNAIERLEKSNSYPIAIISADIDGLKKVNDSYGHKVGDEYIKTCSMILEESTIKGSLIARVGGDEFAIVLPNSDLKNGNEVVANIKRKVKEYDSNIYDVNISLGIAIAENNSVSLEEIYNKADKKMYEDKKKFN